MSHFEASHQSSSGTHREGGGSLRVNGAARERLLSILNGPDELKREFLRERQFSFDALPEWLRGEAFHLAKLEFDKVSKDATLEHLYAYFLACTKSPGPLRGFLNMTNPPPGISGRDFFKKEFARGLPGVFPIRLTEEIFKQVGFHRSKTLAEMVNAGNESASAGTEGIAAPVFLGVYKLESFRERAELPVVLPPFDPRAGGSLGLAAVAARETVGSRIVAFVLLSDLTQALGITLEEAKIRKLVLDLQTDPFVKMKNSPVIRSLLAYADHIVAEGAPSRIPLDEVFGTFAFHRQSIEDMKSENRRRERAAEAQSAMAAPRVERQASPSLPPVDENTVRLKTIIEKSTGQPILDVGDTMRLLRVCVSHAVAPRDLERILADCSGDIVQAIRAIKRGVGGGERDDEKSAAAEKSTEVVSPTPSPRYTVYAHTGDNGFTKWYHGLPDDERQRISEVVSDIAFGRFGKSKAIKAKHISGINEIRVMDLGLRVYFHYLPGQRILLLCGGQKDDQDRDIARAYQYAKEYRRRKHDSLDESSMFPLDSQKSD